METKFIRTEKSECIGLIIGTVEIAIDDDLGFDTDYIQTKKHCARRENPLPMVKSLIDRCGRPAIVITLYIYVHNVYTI